MLGVLLETKAARQRRSGSALLSAIVHSAILAAIVAGATTRRLQRTPTFDIVPRPVFVTPTPVQQNVPAAGRISPDLAGSLPVIRAPNLVPRALPPVIPNALPIGDPSDVVIGSSDRPGVPRGVLDDTKPTEGPADWHGSEALMHIRAAAAPDYPEMLRHAGLAGHVILRFIVDTTGRVDMSSVETVESTHEVFTRSARDVLPRFRFEPSRVNGRAVRAVAELPFEFVLK